MELLAEWIPPRLEPRARVESPQIEASGRVESPRVDFSSLVRTESLLSDAVSFYSLDGDNRYAPINYYINLQ